MLSGNRDLNSPQRFSSIAIPGLSELPFVGPLLFNLTPLTYAMIVLVVVLQFALFRTRWGLRLRSVGEKPRAADTVGINVNRTRWRAVLLGGAVAGLGGSWFTLDSVGAFSREMSGGRGFIALAAMLVGRYSPVGAFGAALLFGFATAFADALQILSTGCRRVAAAHRAVRGDDLRGRRPRRPPAPAGRRRAALRDRVRDGP